jgi:hypothetical protein
VFRGSGECWDCGNTKQIKTKNTMIKKIAIIATAALIAVSTAAEANKVKVENKSNQPFFYKVGKSVKKISPGGSRVFKTTKKKVFVKVSANKSGGFKGTGSVTPGRTLQTNPVTGQNTPL